MGVLDDAIREHLELKRQHGVPEEELQRQEEEALGPARRDVAPADTGDGGAAAEPELHDQETMLQEPEPEPEPAPATPTEEAPAEQPPFDGAAEVSAPEPEAGGAVSEEIAVHEPEADDDPVAEADLVAPDLPEEDAAGELGGPNDTAEELSFEHDDADDPPQPSGGDTQPSGFQPVDDQELLDEDELDEDDADVLEDTPDFLQETPEHDRLWFEQKPPRDFDFD
jgi:hypothetical protein